MKQLTCDMEHDCQQPITHIGEKGYIYCSTHAVARRQGGYERTRQMRAWELKLIADGKPLPSYEPQPAPVAHTAPTPLNHFQPKPNGDYHYLPATQGRVICAYLMYCKGRCISLAVKPVNFKDGYQTWEICSATGLLMQVMPLARKSRKVMAHVAAKLDAIIADALRNWETDNATAKAALKAEVERLFPKGGQ